MKSITSRILFLALLPTAIQAEPIISSWYTGGSARYARIWATQAQETTERSGGGQSSLTTWSSANYAGVNVGDQTEPVYAGIQGISYSNTYVYIKSTGLATNTMGPWHLNAAQTTQFPSFPGNAAILYLFPRTVNYPVNYAPAARTNTNPGNCGLFVDGVPMFNGTDTFSYDTSAGGDQEPTNQNQGDGYWNRDAFTNEGVTFDSGNAHQAMEAFHYHASPSALRHALGDSVDYDPSVVYQGIGGASPYTENFNGKHSPVIGWVNDGLPMYGPYGFSDPNDASSSIRRMITGYQKRDGTNGSTNLNTTGRHTLPQWQVTQGNRTTTTLTAAQYGPNVSAAFTIGHYMEDYDYKGDRTGHNFYDGAFIDGAFIDGTHYDLNAYNVRYCVTPEFPAGTWAYFNCIEANGTPVYPYNLANKYFGVSTTAASITAATMETTGITVQFAGAAEMEPDDKTITVSSGNITLTWQGVEGGIYRVDTSDNLSIWNTSATPATATAETITAQDTITDRQFYRLTQTGLANYDDTAFSTGTGGGPGGGGGGEPGTGNPTDGFVFSFTDGPPAQNLISNVRVGNVTGTVVAYAVNGPTGGTVTISFNHSTFISGNSYTASFTHPGGNMNAISTNTYTKP
jgi:hypothetical protein